MSYAETRTARKDHRCGDHGCRIPAGSEYARWVAFPGDDANAGDRPKVAKVCRSCQTRYDRPMPPRRTKRTAGPS